MSDLAFPEVRAMSQSESKAWQAVFGQDTLVEVLAEAAEHEAATDLPLREYVAAAVLTAQEQGADLDAPEAIASLTAMLFPEGQHVKIGALDARWAKWTLERFPGCTGVVEEVKADRYLVRFDKPIQPGPGRLLHTHFHFEAKYLAAI